MRNNFLKTANVKPFKPPWFMSGPLAQTIIPYYLPHFTKKVSAENFQVELPDGDQLAIAIETPPDWKLTDKIVVLIHGLAGSQDSSFIRRIGGKFFKKNYLVVKVNLRGCGPGISLAHRPYHSGRSEDAFAVLTWLIKKFPESSIYQIGFSLSANITIKMLGEGRKLPKQLVGAVAVCPPADLNNTAKKITKAWYGLFDIFFLFRLKKHVQEIKKYFPEKITVKFPKGINIMDFDDLYTAPYSGFKNGKEYYDKSSCKNFAETVNTKCLILHSTDDPVVDSSPLSSLKLNDCVDLVETTQGGHVGFFSSDFKFWMDDLIIQWVGIN